MVTSNINDDCQLSLTSKEGWNRFVNAGCNPPELFDRGHWTQLTEEERFDYDQARIDHHTRLVTVRTGIIKSVANTGRQLVILNRNQIGARRGLLVFGPSGTGKTTAVTQLGLAHQSLVQRRYPDAEDRIPVVYITVPPAATPRMLTVEFAQFLGIPINRSWNQADIANAVCQVLYERRCEIVIIDEIHNLDLRTRAGAEASDQLKYLAERIMATFVYAGIDVGDAGLFAGTRGRQITRRFVSVSASPFYYGTQRHRREWTGLVATMEEALRLHNHQPGTLPRLAKYLHVRTSGMIGSLSHLLRSAAINAIASGTEKITKTAMKEILLDHAAEESNDLRKAT